MKSRHKDGDLIGVGLEENCSSCKQQSICHDREGLDDIGDLEYRGGGEDVFEFFEHSLLQWGPVPGFVFPC